MARARRNDGGTLRQLSSGRWQVRVLDRSDGRHVSIGTYRTKTEAKSALTTAVADQARQKWVSPDKGKVTVGAYAEQWITGHTGLGPRTHDLYSGLLRRHVAPNLGKVALGDLTTAKIRRWHKALHDNSPGQAAKAYRFLRAVCTTAVEDRVLAVNPCTLKGAGTEPTSERPTATVAEVAALADAVPDRFRALVLLGAWASLRLGELAALTRADVDLLHGTVSVTKNRQTLEGGRGSVVVKPKSAAGRRKVTIPPPILPAVVAHLARYVDPAPDALVFTGERGAALNRHGWNHEWRKARAEVGRTDLHFHDLRHTGNTLAAATGASTKELMARMGHSSMRAALVYQHASEDRDAAIANAMGDLLDAAAVTRLHTVTG